MPSNKHGTKRARSPHAADTSSSSSPSDSDDDDDDIVADVDVASALRAAPVRPATPPRKTRGRTRGARQPAPDPPMGPASRATPQGPGDATASPPRRRPHAPARPAVRRPKRSRAAKEAVRARQIAREAAAYSADDDEDENTSITLPCKKLTQVKFKPGIGKAYPIKGENNYVGCLSRTVMPVKSRSYAGDRPTQKLIHAAAVLKKSLAKGIETQLALVGGHVLVAFNDDDLAEEQREYLGGAHDVRAAMTALAGQVAGQKYKGRAEEKDLWTRHVNKFRTRNPLDDIWPSSAGSDCVRSLDADADNVGSALQSLLGLAEGQVIFIKMPKDTKAHAEQKILIALCKAVLSGFVPDAIVIAGTFRPCRVCFESLTLAATYCLPDLQHGANAGRLWKSNAAAHVKLFNILAGRIGADLEELLQNSGVQDSSVTTTHVATIASSTASSGFVEANHIATESDTDEDEDPAQVSRRSPNLQALKRRMLRK